MLPRLVTDLSQNLPTIVKNKQIFPKYATKFICDFQSMQSSSSVNYVHVATRIILVLPEACCLCSLLLLAFAWLKSGKQILM